MTDTAALDALIEAVTAGVLPDEDWRLMHDIWSPRNWHEIGHNVRYSMHGSLDAAKALHEALLPGWGWETGVNATFVSIASVWKSGRERAYGATSEIPARSWLLAALKACRASL